MKPLAIDLYCGLGGWTDGLVAEGYDVVGFDIECHVYGWHRYPAQLVVQDVLTLHGDQFRDAALIVASPPCQEYSYMAMPWTKAKAKAAAIRADASGAEIERLNRLFNACLRIQREASAAAGRHIPLIIENVRGAQPWVGRSRWSFSSFHLWGDVPALMPPAMRVAKSPGLDWNDRTRKGQAFNPAAQGLAFREELARKNGGGLKVPGFRFDGSGRSFQSASVAHNTTSGKGNNPDGRKVPGGGAEGWFGGNDEHPLCKHHSGHAKRKFASAMIAKIPLPLSRHIGRVFHPEGGLKRCFG